MNEIQDLIDELDVAAGRITQYSNSPLDGLLNAAARKLEELAGLTPPGPLGLDPAGQGDCGCPKCFGLRAGACANDRGAT